MFMNKIFADRIRLIGALKVACKEMENSCDSNDILNIKDSIVKIRSDVNDFLSISQKDKASVSYSKNSEDKLNNKNRIRTTLGKYIRRRIGKKPNAISDVALDLFIAKVKTIISIKEIDNQITIIKGKDIIEEYRKAGNSSHSCMTGSECEKVQLYALNSDKVSLVLHDKARALLWTTDDGTVVLDRVYPAQCHSVELIRKWADLKGFVKRTDPDRVIETGFLAKTTDEKTHTVTLKHRGIFPYMDTFVYAKLYDDYIVAKNDPNFGNITMHSVSGGYRTAKICFKCDCRVNNVDHVTANDGYVYCYACFDRMFFNCDYCGEHKMIEDGKNILPSGHCLCENCTESYTEKCKCCGMREYSDNMHYYENDGYYCWECYSENFINCFKCGERFKREDFIVNNICVNCFKYEKCEHCEVEIKDINQHVYIENGKIICIICGEE